MCRGVKMNLLSIGSLADKGHYFLFGKNEVLVLDSHFQIIGRGHRDKRNGLYKVSIRSTATFANALNTSLNTNQRNLQFMFQNKIVTGLPYLPACTKACKACNFGKQTRDRAPKQSARRYSTPLHLLHSDFYNPFPIPSLAGSRYFLTFTDDYSHFCWVFFLKKKWNSYNL